jgi:hypothetical protein
MDYLATAAEHLLPPLLVILSGVLTALGVAALRWLRARLGLEHLVTDEAIDAAVRDVVAAAAAYAEQLAHRWRIGLDPMPADPARAKLEIALSFVARELRRRQLPEQARDRLVDLLEARLGSTPRAAAITIPAGEPS